MSSSQVRVGTLEAGRIALLISGEVDLANAQLVVDAGTTGLDRDDVEALSIDLGAVTFMDSTALSALITLLNRANATGKALTLTRVPDRIARLLDLTGLSRIFPIEIDKPDRS